MTARAHHALPFTHVALALAVMIVWGSNFVVIKIALRHIPPFALATLRFGLAFLPLAFFIPRPKVPLVNLCLYGVLIGVGQFGLMFLAMRQDITPGLASLVVQSQVFFTIGLSMLLANEKVHGYQVAALLLAVAGLAVIATHADGAATILGLTLVLAAGAAWGAGNMVSREAGQVNMLAYVVWSSAFAVPPLLALSLAFDGKSAVLEGIRAADAQTWAAVLWQSVGNSMFGYAAWGWLLARHPAATITPMALLVPVFGMATSAAVLGEPLPPWKLLASGLVLSGLATGLLWPRISANGRRP